MTSVWIVVNSLASRRDEFRIWGVADTADAAANLIRKRFHSVDVAWEDPICETADYLWSLTGRIRNTFSHNDKLAFHFQRFDVFTQVTAPGKGTRK